MFLSGDRVLLLSHTPLWLNDCSIMLSEVQSLLSEQALQLIHTPLWLSERHPWLSD